MRHSRNAGLAVLLLISTATASLAQGTSKTWEWGFDVVGLGFGLDDPTTTTFSFGSGVFRAGMFVNDQWSVEPALTFDYTSSSGSSFNNLGLDLGVLYHLSTDRAKQQIYIRPAFIFNRFSPSTGSSTTAKAFSVGAGIKRPMMKGKIHGRFAATYVRGLETVATNDVIISGGISVFTP